jgi:hypothetical protein
MAEGWLLAIPFESGRLSLQELFSQGNTYRALPLHPVMVALNLHYPININTVVKRSPQLVKGGVTQP